MEGDFMAVRYRCALCAKTCPKKQLDNYVCQTCQQQYDLNAAWVQELIREEQIWHRSQSNNAAILNFSRLHIRENNRSYDGDDMLNGDVEFPQVRRGRIPKNRQYVPPPPTPDNYLDHLEIVLKWGDVAELSDDEKQAIEIIVLFMQDQAISLEAASQILSDIEGHEVTPFEFQERLNQARQKLIDAGIKI
jgi:hypothetical protein